jgi:hypothetical protein
LSDLRVPYPDLQLAFYRRLQEVRHTFLLDALLETAARLRIPELDQQLARFASNAGLQRMAAWGLRGEIVFAVPYVLEENPRLLGYYRLLLGFSQKQFYGDRYDLGPYRLMEDKGRLPPAGKAQVEDLCRALCNSAESLVANIDVLSRDTAHELTLLTLGPQLRGGALNVLGSKATREVYALIRSLLPAELLVEQDRLLEVHNAAGRVVRVELGPDPDLCIRERLPSGKYRNLIAIELKGGRDYSNVHNRIGEAEKSHQKARKDGYVECWTIVGVSRLDMELARKESPSTDRFYHVESILDGSSEEGQDFRENLLARVGIGI